MLKATKEVNKHLSLLEDVKIFFEEMQAARQSSFENKSEKWQEGEKGEEEQNNLDELENIVSEIETAFDSINNLFEAD